MGPSFVSPVTSFQSTCHPRSLPATPAVHSTLQFTKHTQGVTSALMEMNVFIPDASENPADQEGRKRSLLTRGAFETDCPKRTSRASTTQYFVDSGPEGPW